VHCRVSGFGETGEYGGLPGYDAALQAMSGLMAVTGSPDIDACRIGISIVDTCRGMSGCMGILLALLERNRSGRGPQVEVTLYDAAISMLHAHVTNTLNGGRASRRGNGHPNIVPYDLFPAGTVPLFLAVGNDRQFHTLCAELGYANLGPDPRYRTNGDRVVNCDSLRATLLLALSALARRSIFQRLMPLGVPCGPVLAVEGLWHWTILAPGRCWPNWTAISAPVFP
jgi:crotonobetainyl-CoA:carnitine CoA-transferase CaiB-like acyl-CoA transferase